MYTVERTNLSALLFATLHESDRILGEALPEKQWRSPLGTGFTAGQPKPEKCEAGPLPEI